MTYTQKNAWKSPVAYISALLAVLVIGYLIFSPQAPEKSSEKKFLTILWAKWKPADYLQKLTKNFTMETGIEVEIIQESWSTWQDIFFNEMSAKGERFDMVVGDSQWLGRGVDGGHYIELTKWIAEHGVADTMTPTSLTGYAEFPKTSGHYWAIPLEGDAMGFSYRKDLFEDPKEKKDFKDRFGYELAVPKTWARLKDIAQFFYRPHRDLYGVLCWTEPHYDGITMGIESLIWAWGADLGDPATYRVRSILNSDAGVEALKFYKELNSYNNPEWTDYYLDKDLSSNLPMLEGRVAMAMGYFAIAPELLENPENPYTDKIGFFAAPRGPVTRATSLGGQGISIVSYSKKKDLSLDFIQWFIRDDVQKKWAQLGGLTCNTKVLNSEAFLNASPINKPYRKSMEMVKDFWAVPEYSQLLRISQKLWSEYVNEDARTARETMDIITQKWETVFEYAGYYKE
ncbi:MAG: extracellular solute-binding protein [Desulfobacteraceae bacterium]